MSLALTFTPTGMTAAKYDIIIKKLEEAGAGAPKGRLYHVSYGDKNNLRVLDIWDTMENFEEFGKTLMPVLQQVGVDSGEPDIQPVHNILELVDGAIA